MAIYGYARVSTRTQERDGNSLEAQEDTLRCNGATEIYRDAFTGTKLDRPMLRALLDPGTDDRPGVLRPGDTLVVTKLDRIARSVSQGNELVNGLIARGVRVNILNIGVMDDTAASKLIRNIFFSFAEFERDMIVERTSEGKAIAKLDAGYREGRPRVYGGKQIAHALELLEVKTYRQVEELTGISKSTLVRAKRKAV